MFNSLLRNDRREGAPRTWFEIVKLNGAQGKLQPIVLNPGATSCSNEYVRAKVSIGNLAVARQTTVKVIDGVGVEEHHRRLVLVLDGHRGVVAHLAISADVAASVLALVFLGRKLD